MCAGPHYLTNIVEITIGFDFHSNLDIRTNEAMSALFKLKLKIPNHSHLRYPKPRHNPITYTGGGCLSDLRFCCVCVASCTLRICMAASISVNRQDGVCVYNDIVLPCRHWYKLYIYSDSWPIDQAC